MKKILLMFGIVFVGVSSLTACAATQDPICVLQEKKDAITANPLGVLHSELTKADAGRYRGVMHVKVRDDNGNWKHCTGTVIAPYAVLTAASCRGSLGQFRADRSVRWGNISMEIDNDFTNPFGAKLAFFRALNLRIPHDRINGHALESPFAPRWFLEANNATRTDPVPFPNMHDAHIFFVSKLDPEFIQNAGIVVGRIDAFAQFRALPAGHKYASVRGVGVGSTGGDKRQSVNLKLVEGSTRKGFITVDTDARKYGKSDQGDEGGPAFMQLWHNDTELTSDPGVIVGTHQNGVDLVPFAYLPTLSTIKDSHTIDTIRRNHLWAMARMRDVDNDGIVDYCDPKLHVFNQANENRCPAQVGSPKGAVTQGYPKGLLMCRNDEYVAGYRGRYSYNGVIHLALLCRPKSCLSSNSTCQTQYWTDTYGADANPDGDNFAITDHLAVCPAKKAFNGMAFGLANDEIFQITPSCVDSPSGDNPVNLPAMGRVTKKDKAHAVCPKKEFIVGIVAHNRTSKRISGVQVICSGVLDK